MSSPAAPAEASAPTDGGEDSQKWAAVIVASSAGLLLLGFACLVAALARRHFLRRRRVHYDVPDDDEEAALFSGVLPGPRGVSVAWGDTASYAAVGWKGRGDVKHQHAAMNLYEQFRRVHRHPPYDPRAVVESEVKAVVDDMVSVIVRANPAPPPRTLPPLASPSTPGTQSFQSQPRYDARASPGQLPALPPPALPLLSPPPLTPVEASLPIPTSSPLTLPRTTANDAVRLVRARSEAHRKQLEGLRAIKSRFMERTKQLYGDEMLGELSTVERAVEKFLRANKRQENPLLPEPPQPRGDEVDSRRGDIYDVDNGDEGGSLGGGSEGSGRRSQEVQHTSGGAGGGDGDSWRDVADGRKPSARRSSGWRSQEGQAMATKVPSLTPAEEAQVDAALDALVAGVVKERITAVLEMEKQRQQRGREQTEGNTAGSYHPRPPVSPAAVMGRTEAGGADVMHPFEASRPRPRLQNGREAVVTEPPLDSSRARLSLHDIAEDGARELLETSVLRAGEDVVREDDMGGRSSPSGGASLWLAAAESGLAQTSSSSSSRPVSNMDAETIVSVLASLPSDGLAGRPRRAVKKSKNGKKKKQVEP